MERGETSHSSESEPINEAVWAKLVPSDSRYSDIELEMSETVICSETCILSSEKTEWCKISRNMDLISATLQNTSETAIFVDDMVVHEGDTSVLDCGSEIIPGSRGKGLLSYRFKLMPIKEPCEKQLKISLDAEHAKCSICLNIWHDVVTVAPCLHNFCNGCFSEWLKRSQEKRSSVLCPQCRAVVQFVGRNHFLHGIEEDLLQADASLRRSSEELEALDACASIKSPLVISRGNKTRRKRMRSPADEEDVGGPACPQCGDEFAGFQCNQSTVHLQCHGCGGMMPSRRNLAVPQHCLGCDRAFCGAYWHSQGIDGTDSHPTCDLETLKPIAERSTIRIPFSVHEKNRHEQDITENCIRRMGRTLQDVINEWIVRLNNREIDRTRMQLNHAEMITSQTYTCIVCYEKLVSFLLYWFRITLPKEYLSSERVNCWYGYACRTQHHNEEHARKRNHVCRPTRGTHLS